jgi:hypothetical protein
MLGDLDDIIDAAVGAHGGKPCLVEVGRALHEHTTTTAFVWSTGRITAAVGMDWSQLERRLGVLGDAVRLDFAELHALDVACRDWAKRRDEWAAYLSYAAAPPPYGGSAYCYLPPGSQSRPARIGMELMGKLRGERFCGRDEIVPMSEAVELADGVLIAAEIWRRGERHGPADGSLTGLRYRLVDGVTVDAERQEAKVVRGRKCVYLEPGEELFVAAVLGLVGRDGGQTRRPR